MSGIDFLAIAVAIEPMSASLNIDIATVQWFLSAYAIGNSSFLVTAGRLSDLYGRKNIFMIGAFVFILSSAVIAMSNSPLVIIISRMIQGASSGVTTSSAITILANLYTSAERTRWIAGLVGTTGFGMVMGPTLGGLLVHYFSWRMVFIINIPLGLLGLLFAFLYMPYQPPHNTHQKLDLIGMALFTITLALFTIGISQGQFWGWSNDKTLLSFGGSLLALLCFFYSEHKSPAPLTDLSLFKIDNFLVANSIAACMYFTWTAWALVFGIYLQRTMGMDPQDAGLALFPFGIVAFFLSLRMAKISAYFGMKNLITLGCALGAIAFIGLAFIPVHPSYWILVPYFMLYGGCFVIVNSCTMQAALEFIPVTKAGIASGKSMMLRWLWGAIGAAVISTVFTVGASARMGKVASKYTELNAQLPFLHEVVTGQKTASDLPSVFQGDSLSLSKEAVFQGTHHGLILSMIVLAGVMVFAFLLSQFFLKKGAHPVR